MAVMDSDSRMPLESQMNMMFSPTKNIESSPLSLLDTVKLQLQNIINIPEILINAVSPQQFTSRMTNQRASATLEGLSLGLRKLDSSKEDPSTALQQGEVFKESTIATFSRWTRSIVTTIAAWEASSSALESVNAARQYPQPASQASNTSAVTLSTTTMKCLISSSSS